MHADHEVITAPLSRTALAERWRELIDDPRYQDLPGRIELDTWGRITMTPVSTWHADSTGRIAALLLNSLGGHALPEVGIATEHGICAPDVAWCSDAFWAMHRDTTPLPRAPEICVEVASPSNTRPDLQRKTAAYLAAGAVEVWIVYPRSRRVELFGSEGALEGTRFAVKLDALFA